MTANVLGLTTTAWSSFYEQQEAAVERVDVEYETLEVPGDHRAFDNDIERRSPLDYARFLPMVLRRSLQSYDLIHANYGLTAPFAVAQPRLPVVVTLWGGEFIGNQFSRVIRASVKHADAIVVPSQAMADRVSTELRDRTYVVPFPVDTNRFQPEPRARARAEVGWETDKQVVLFPYARDRYEKHYAFAERVVSGLSDDVELRTVSNEPYEHMPAYLNASDALIVTSRWESGPMTVKEALACELPVVSRPVGFVPDLAGKTDACRVGRSIRELRTELNDVLQSESAQTGRDLVVENDTETMGYRLRQIYHRCLNDA